MARRSLSTLSARRATGLIVDDDGLSAAARAQAFAAMEAFNTAARR